MLIMIRLTANKFILFALVMFFLTPLYPQIAGDLRIGIIHSELTKQFLHKNNNNFYPIQDWELFFLNRKISYRVFSDDDFENSSFSDIDVLILPSVEILSDYGIESLKDFLADGKSILILGKLGVYDESGRIRKQDALSLLTGLETKEFPVENSTSCYQEIYADNFLGLSLEQERDIQILNQFTPLYANEIPAGGQILGEYSLPNKSKDGKDIYPGIIIYEGKNKSKILWFGFQSSQISVRENRESILEKIFLNSLSIIGDKPAVWINSYPSNFGSAAVLECDVFKAGDFFPAFQSTANELNIRTDFFITPSEVSNSFDQLNALATIGNLNILFDGFTYPGKDQYYIDSIFKSSYEFLSGESRQAATAGFGIKFLNVYEYQLEEYLAEESKKYFNFYLTEDHSFNILKNDLEMYVEHKNNFKYQSKGIFISLTELLNQDYSIRSSLKDKIEQAEKTAEVIIFYLDSKALEKIKTNNKYNFQKVLNVVKENNCWITTYSELLNWFLVKQNLKVEVISNDEESLFTLNVSNSGDTIVNNVSLVISIPSSYKNIKLKSFNYKLDYNRERGAYYLLIPFIKAGENILIDFEFEGR